MDHSQAVWTQRVSEGRGTRRYAPLYASVVFSCAEFWCPSRVAALADTPAPAVGLKGIIPAEVPEGLTNGISQLPENWGKWGGRSCGGLGGGTTASADSDAATHAYKLLDSLKAGVKTLQNSLADPKYIRAPMEDVLVTLREGLSRRIDVLEAALATLELDPASAKADQVKAAGAQVVGAAGTLDAYLKPIPNSAGWVKYFKVDKLVSSLDAGADALAAAQLHRSNSKRKAV